MSEVILDVRNVSKKFKLNQSRSDSFKGVVSSAFKTKNSQPQFLDALKDISFSVKKGEVLGIIGGNGAGKSTLLKILSGILLPDTGEIDFYGKAASILDVGAGFHPELTGAENVYLASSLHGFSRAETDARFEEIVEFSGIRKFINEPVKNYSAGMYLRLAFSIIAHVDADIFIFDEVLAVGDAAFQIKCRKKFEEIIRMGKSVVMVSHNLAEVAKFADNVICLQNGKISETGDAGEVIESYIEDAVKGEFSDAAKNDKPTHSFESSMHDCRFFDGLKVKVKSGKDSNPNLFFTTDAIVIEIEINKKINRAIVPGLFVSDINDSIALTTTTLNSLEIAEDKNQTGKCCFTVMFPPDYFNNTIIVFSFFFVVLDDSRMYNRAERIAVNQKLMLKIEEGTSTLKSVKKMPGVIRPKLEWKISNQ